MLSDTQDLDEVVVVAYGTTKKSSFTGSASVVKSDQLEKISATSFTEALQGMSAGVNVSNNEGNPGAKLVSKSVVSVLCQVRQLRYMWWMVCLMTVV